MVVNCKNGSLKYNSTMNCAKLPIHRPTVLTSFFLFFVRSHGLCTSSDQIHWLAVCQRASLEGARGWTDGSFKVARYQLVRWLHSSAPSDKRAGFGNGVCPRLHCDLNCTYYFIFVLYCTTKVCRSWRFQPRKLWHAALGWIRSLSKDCIDVNKEYKLASYEEKSLPLDRYVVLALLKNPNHHPQKWTEQPGDAYEDIALSVGLKLSYHKPGRRATPLHFFLCIKYIIHGFLTSRWFRKVIYSTSYSFIRPCFTARKRGIPIFFKQHILSPMYATTFCQCS
jgi:hypothetical protein